MRTLILLTLLGLFTFSAQCQKVKPMRATLGSTGGSAKQGTSNIYILQSVGQASVIGSFSKNKSTVRQGFIQPLEKIKGRVASSELKLNAYPNPTSGEITIEFQDILSQSAKIVIYDLRGKIMHTESTRVAQKHVTDIEQLQPGMYFMEIISGHRVARLKILKK